MKPKAKPKASRRVRIPLSPTLLLLLAACSGDSSSGNRAPIVAISSPFTGNTFAEGDEVLLEGSARDPEEGDLAGASLEWSSDRDGTIASGASVTTRGLSFGPHAIRLTATDAQGRSGSAEVRIRIYTPAGTSPRAGELNPYAGRLARTPAKLDDELIVVGRSSALDEASLGIVDVPIDAYEGPSSAPSAPRTTARLAGAIPVAAAAGRPLDSNLHLAAIVLQPSGGAGPFALELVGLDDPGEDRIAEHPFLPLFPAGPVDVRVADLDAFEESGGAKSMAPPADANSEYHDEVALAHADLLNGELVARIDVLSFESVGFPLDPAAPLPGPTSLTTGWTTPEMHPASRVVLRHGDAFFGSIQGPHLLAAYVDSLGRIAIDVLEYAHTRPDPQMPDPTTDLRGLVHVLHAIVSAPLDAATIAAGGWDVEVGRAERLGMNMLAGFDVVLVVHDDGGSFVQQAWKLEGLDGSAGPVSLGQESGEFARVPDGMGGEIGLTLLPDTRVRIALGRIVDNLTNRCEALGIFVLADTNRGAVVQSLSAFVDDPFIGNYRFGPVSEVPAWPHQLTIRNHAETTLTTKTSLVAGGFVSQRNALVDDRGDPAGAGTEFAMDCDDTNTRPMLGPMPSFYVADPDASELHAVTMVLGGGGIGIAVTAPLDPALDERALLLAADATGDAAYYDSTQCAGSAPGDCRRVFLGDAELHYVIEDIETKNVLLQQPPKHVDHLPALGGIVDVSMDPGYFAEFVQTDQASGSVMRKTKTDWSIGARVEFGLGPPAPKGEEFSSVFEMALDAEHRSVQEQFSSSQVALSLTQTTGAVDDDVVWSKQQTIDYWRFAAQGGKPLDDPDAPSGFPDDAYMEVAIPDDPRTLIGPGSLNEDYQPTHVVGNILSYPTFSDAQSLAELFEFLGSYVPSDANGTRECKPLENGDPSGCLILVNNALQRVAEVLAGDDFVGGEFQSLSNPIDVADVLQVGGISYSAELEFESSVKNGLSVTNNDTIKGEVNLKIPLKTMKFAGPQVGKLDTQLRASASFENATVSENTLGSKAKVALHLPASIPVERSYRIQPSFGFTPGGSLQVSYQVDTDGAAGTFWETHYSTPDPALNMPHRIVRTPAGFRLGTDVSRDKIKGFFVRDGEGIDPAMPAERQGDLLTEVPSAGDPLQLEVRVSNLSVATEVYDLDVVFSVQAYRNGQAEGAEVPIGVATIDFLPHRGQFPNTPEGHVASAFILWDTTGFGPPPTEALITYLVRVTLDPDDRVRDETHELHDRYADPLLGPTGQVLDPGLEKGQNNTGWAMVRLAPPDAQQALSGRQGAGPATRRAPGESETRESEARIELGLAGGESRRAAPIRGRVQEPLLLRVELRSERPVLDYGRLQVFDGDPAAGATMILSRTVQGISGADLEEFVWRPQTKGRRVLHAVYTGSRAGAHPELQIPVIVAD